MTRTVAIAGTALRGPRPLPLLGARGNFLRFFSDPVGQSLRLHREYGEVCTLTQGELSVLCLFGPTYNQQVLSDRNLFHNNDKAFFPVPETARQLLSGLTSMNGELHRRQRKLMMPPFQRSRVEGYRDDMVALTERALSRWTPGRTLDVSGEMTELTLQIALHCLFGIEDEQQAHTLGHLGMDFLEGLTSPAVMMLPRAVPGTPYARFVRTSHALHARLLELIRHKRTLPEGRDVLSMLLRAHDEDGSALTDEELLGQASVIYVAGHETTSHTLSWTLFLLSQHPRVLADLEDELSGTLRGAAPSVEQLSQLPLLDAVVKESMRLLPATPLLFVRFATDAFQLGPYALPKGTGVMLSPLVTHRLPDLYPEPDRFLPERWQRLQPSLYEYLPFGAGPRMCLGATFASQEVRLVLATLLQRFRLSLAPEARVSCQVRGITLGPRHGMPMRVGRRDTPLPPPARVRGDISRIVRLES
jgi:cytochrome P450